MNNQQTVSQNQMNIANQSQPGSLAGLTSGVTKAWKAIMSLMQTAVGKNENGASVSPDDGTSVASDHIMPDYALSLVLYPHGTTAASTSIKNYESQCIKVEQLPINENGLRINRVYCYKNMILCPVIMGPGFQDAVNDNNNSKATEYVQGIVNLLVPDEEPNLNFMWSIIPWNTLGGSIPENDKLSEVLTGTTGGGDFGG